MQPTPTSTSAACSRLEAARIIATSTNTVVCYFRKRTDGTLRRMCCRYYGDPIRSGLVRVWDIEKGAWRQVNLDAVQQVKVLGARRHEPQQPSYAAAKAEMDQLFY